jgi:hypothetical protein
MAVVLVLPILAAACKPAGRVSGAAERSLRSDTVDLVALLPADAQPPYSVVTQRRDSVVFADVPLKVHLRWTTGHKGGHRYVTGLIADYPPLPSGQSLRVEAASGSVVNLGTKAARLEAVSPVIRWTDGGSRLRAAVVTLVGDGRFNAHGDSTAAGS